MKPAHTPETEEYGIKSWIYRRHRPFHPKRFYDFMLKLQNNPNNLFKQCIRAKGTIWIASRHLHSFQFHKAGTLVSLNPLDLWYAEIPRENWGGNKAEIQETWEVLQRTWQEPYGDRCIELVFIGIDQDQAAMTKMLDGALLNDKEYQLGPEVWAKDKKKFEDQFPAEFSEHLIQKHQSIKEGWNLDD